MATPPIPQIQPTAAEQGQGRRNLLTGFLSVIGPKLRAQEQDELNQKVVDRDLYRQLTLSDAFAVHPGDESKPSPNPKFPGSLADYKTAMHDSILAEYQKRASKGEKNIIETVGPVLKHIFGHKEKPEEGDVQAGSGSQPPAPPSAAANKANTATPPPPPGPAPVPAAAATDVPPPPPPTAPAAAPAVPAAPNLSDVMSMVGQRGRDVEVEQKGALGKQAAELATTEEQKREANKRQDEFTFAQTHNPLPTQIKNIEEVLGRPLSETEVALKTGVIPKGLKKVWTRDPGGKPYSMMVNALNQPVSGSENYDELPPAYMIPKIRQGEFSFVDENNVLHRVPTTSTTTPVLPGGSGGNATPGGAGAPRKASRGVPGPPPAASAISAGQDNLGMPEEPALPAGSRTIGAKANPLTTQAQGIMMKTAPVVSQVDSMLKHIDELKLGDNNEPGYLFMDRAKYKFGIAPKTGTLGEDIAGLSLGSLVEAVSALGGTSRSMTALHIAMDHTPNAWVDSPKMIKQKLTEIRKRLKDIEDDANTYGRKVTPAQPRSGEGHLGNRKMPSPPPGASSGRRVIDFTQPSQ